MNKSAVVAFGKEIKNMDELVDALCDEVEKRIGVPLCEIESPKLRRQAVRQLDEFGIFSLRYAAVRISKRMMISKVSLYQILKGSTNV